MHPKAGAPLAKKCTVHQREGCTPVAEHPDGSVSENEKLPDAQLSKAPAVSYSEFQLDILTKLAEHIVHINEAVGSSPTVTTASEGLICKSSEFFCLPASPLRGALFSGFTSEM